MKEMMSQDEIDRLLSIIRGEEKNMKRIKILDDGWCFGIKFFIQAALFEKTGYADWKLNINVSSGFGAGEINVSIKAKRCVKEIHKGNEPIKKEYKKMRFSFRANSYSNKSIYINACKEIEGLL